MDKYLKYHSCDTCLEYAHSLSELSEITKELLNYFKSGISIFVNLVVPTSVFFNYVFQLDNISTDFSKYLC